VIFIINLKYKVGQIAFIKNEVEALDLQCIKNKKLYISEIIKSNNFDYKITVDGVSYKVREKEIISLEEVENMFKIDDKVIVDNAEYGTIKAIYPSERVADVDIPRISMSQVIDYSRLKLVGNKDESIASIENSNKNNKFEQIANELGRFTDDKNRQYGSSVDVAYETFKVLLERYTYDDDNYLIPKSLLPHMLLQVRMMDKINRIFNNPSGKGDAESPYKDLTGYSLIGVDMIDRLKKEDV